MQPEKRRPPRRHVPRLSPRDEAILRTIHQYRFMTAIDVAQLLFSPTSLEHVRQVLTALAGGADIQPHAYLCRFPLPTVSGNAERIFTLGSRGRSFIEHELGLPCDWFFRPAKLRHLSFSHLRHSLSLTRLMVAAHRFCRGGEFELVSVRLSHELARTSIKVIPDGWLLFEDRQGNKYPILIEIDRGMEYQDKFKRHVSARLEFIRSGEYTHNFATQAVMIAYATIGQTAEYRHSRRQHMCAWIMEVLKERDALAWASIFRVTSLVYEEIYTTPLFAGLLWYQPNVSQPMPLLVS